MLNPFICLCIAFHMVNQETDQLALSYYIFKHIAAALGWGDTQKAVILKPVSSGSGNPPLLSALRAEPFGDLKQTKWELCFSRLTRSVIPLITSDCSPFAKVVHKAGCCSNSLGRKFCCHSFQQWFKLRFSPTSFLFCSSVFNSWTRQKLLLCLSYSIKMYFSGC